MIDECRRDQVRERPRPPQGASTPGEAAAAALAQEKHAVEHAGNGVQLGVQIAERAALAGDVDQIRGTAMQEELIARR